MEQISSLLMLPREISATAQFSSLGGVSSASSLEKHKSEGSAFLSRKFLGKALLSNGWCGTSATFQSFLCQLGDENVCTRYSPPCVWFLFRFRRRLILWGDWWHDHLLKLGHLWPYIDCTTCGMRHLEGRNLGPSYIELTGGVGGDWASKLTTEYSWSWAYSTLHICSYTGWEQDLLSQPLLLLLSASPLSVRLIKSWWSAILVFMPKTQKYSRSRSKFFA